MDNKMKIQSKNKLYKLLKFICAYMFFINIVIAQDEVTTDNLPNVNETTFDSNELSVLTYIHSEMSTLAGKVNRVLEMCNHEILHISLITRLNALKNTSERARLRIQNIVEEETLTGSELLGKVNRIKKDYLTFREENRIKREPNYPDAHIYYIATIVLIILGEAILNGYFFAAGNDKGLLGGVFQALIIAFINVIPAFCIGKWIIPYKNHIKTNYIYLTFIFMTIYGAWIILFNLSVAHYRDLFAISADDIHLQAIANLLEAPMDLSSMDSWMLWAVGIIFSLIAVVDGYKYDDPYPKYGDIHRRYKLVQDDQVFHKEEIKEEIRNLYTKVSDKVDKLREGHIDDFAEIRRWVGLKESTLSRYDNHLEDIRLVGVSLLTLYRETNRSIRDDEAPQYFSTPPSFKPAEIIGRDTGDAETLEKEGEAKNTIQSSLDEIQNNIEEIFNDAIARVTQ